MRRRPSVAASHLENQMSHINFAQSIVELIDLRSFWIQSLHDHTSGSLEMSVNRAVAPKTAEWIARSANRARLIIESQLISHQPTDFRCFVCFSSVDTHFGLNRGRGVRICRPNFPFTSRSRDPRTHPDFPSNMVLLSMPSFSRFTREPKVRSSKVFIQNARKSISFTMN